ncbi:MAG: hypothetical protein ACSW8F_05135, partial [bacterium]
LDPAGKRARQLTRADYARFDLIIGMDDWNMKTMRRLFSGDPEHKLRLLLSFTPTPAPSPTPGTPTTSTPASPTSRRAAGAFWKASGNKKLRRAPTRPAVFSSHERGDAAKRRRASVPRPPMQGPMPTAAPAGAVLRSARRGNSSAKAHRPLSGEEKGQLNSDAHRMGCGNRSAAEHGTGGNRIGSDHAGLRVPLRGAAGVRTAGHEPRALPKLPGAPL